MVATKRTSSASKPAAKKSAAPGGAHKSRQAVIRMYNVGFGDAFLVTVPNGQKQSRILFDCGSVEASKTGGAMTNIVKQIIKDATDPDGIARIDVVVATHRHKDHVSGFANAAWEKVEVQEVWMPWTEHPTDADARRIRELQSRLALGLNASLAAAPAATLPADLASRAVVAAVVDNANPLSNAPAMKTLHSGFAGSASRRFLPVKGADARSLETSALPGVKVHVLGPSRDPDVIRDMDPPKGESYLRLRNAVAGLDGTAPVPFAPEFMLQESTGNWVFSPDERDEISKAGSLSELAVAVALDQAVNGTSLMLLLEVAGTFLLFPGDAQWGTWKRVLDDDEWKDLLQRLSFYKIGHHGSHNATPQTFVKTYLPVGCCAMASTLTRKIWPDIPRLPLLTGLLEKQAVVARSDQPDGAVSPFEVLDGVIEARVNL